MPIVVILNVVKLSIAMLGVMIESIMLSVVIMMSVLNRSIMPSRIILTTLPNAFILIVAAQLEWYGTISQSLLS